MQTKRGYTSTWHFCHCSDGWYAFGGCHKPLVKRFDNVMELRTLYRNYLTYGYKPTGSVAEDLARTILISDPWDSTLPLSMQQELDALACA